MIQSFVLTTGLALAIVQLALINDGQVQATGPFKDFKELYAATLELESAEMVLEQKGDKFNSRRSQLLEKFARETKRDKCSSYMSSNERFAAEFKVKATSYINTCKSGQNNWVVNVFKGGPAGDMKYFVRNEPLLSEVANRYEIQGKNGQLKETDIECDILKFRIQTLDPIFVVLTTDVRYLVTEDSQILNKNIRAQMYQDKLTATHNYYKIKLSAEQKRLLFEYFAYHKDLTAIDVEEALEHFNTPSKLITGRLMDSCDTIVSYKKTWNQLEEERVKICRNSKSDPNNETFLNKFNADKYEHTVEFCKKFLNSITFETKS